MRKNILALAAVAFVATLGLGAVAYNQANVAKAAEGETPVFAMVGGAQVRTTDPSGIRFVTKANDAYKDQLYAQYSEAEYTYVWGTTLTFAYQSETYTIDAPTKQWTENDTQWYTALVGIPESDYLTAITAQSYVKVYAADKSIAFEEFVGNAQTRSIAQTASLALNSGKYSNDDILYTYTNAIPNAEVEIEQTSGVLAIGGKVGLSATVTEGYGIAWRSSNKEVATVDENGIVTAVGSGTATITARLGTATDTYQVEVIAESDLLKDKKLYTGSNQFNLAYVDDVSAENDGAYGNASLPNDGTNSSTMYFEFSNAALTKLFADELVGAVSFDVILDQGNKKIQGPGGNNETLYDGSVAPVPGKEYNGKTYYSYTVSITRARWDKLAENVDMKFRYTGGSTRSLFFFIDNLKTVKELQESELVKSVYATNTFDLKETAFGWGNDSLPTDGSASSTMKFDLSYTYLSKIFADTLVDAISFDIIVDINNKKIQDVGLSNANLFDGTTTNPSTLEYNGKTYYVYTVSISRDRFNKLNGKNLVLRYTNGSKCTFFHIDNLSIIEK